MTFSSFNLEIASRDVIRQDFSFICMRHN